MIWPVSSVADLSNTATGLERNCVCVKHVRPFAWATVYKCLGKNAMTFTDIFRPFFMDHPQQLPEASRLFLVEARAVLAQTERAQNIAGCAQCDAIGEFHIGLFASALFSISVVGELIAF